MVLDKDQIAYITFILGADNFDICHKIRNLPQSCGLGIDEIYDLTTTIATAFNYYDQLNNASANISEYDSLNNFLRDYAEDLDNWLNGTLNDLVGRVVIKETTK